MKTKITLFVTSLLLFTFLSGCIATHNGYLTDSASLNSPNFVYKKVNAVGEAKATYVLGIGGVARKSLVLEAKKQMLALNPLQKNQALANVTASFKTTYFFAFIVVTTKCTVSADIVEFVSDQTNILSQNQIAPSTTPQINTAPVIIQEETKEGLTLGGFSIGDFVKFKISGSEITGQIKGFIENKAIIEYTKKDAQNKVIKITSEIKIDKISYN